MVCFGKLAEVCGEYLTRGKQVYLEGTIRGGKWQDPNGNERKSFGIVAHWMQMLSPGSNGNGSKSKDPPAPKTVPQAGASQAAAQPSEEDNPFEEDESVPF